MTGSAGSRGHGGPGDDDETPPCAVCARRGGARREELHLTHGVSVWLCPVHGDERFLTRRGGWELAERLARMWAATGVLTRRRMAAVCAHAHRVRQGGSGRARPGSYSWPLLRAEAERRFAAGEDPAAVIRELRAGCAEGTARAPSVRTMRRWFLQARWMPPAPADARGRTSRPSNPLKRLARSMAEVAPRGMQRNVFWPWFEPLFDDP